jgi:hypothetical protein
MKVSTQGKLIKSEKFYLHGISNIKSYNNFYRYGDFFVLKEGGYFVGDGPHSIGIYLFKEVLPQNSITYIPLFSVFESYQGKDKIYSATMKIQKDKLILRYKLMKGKYTWNGIDRDVFIRKSTRKLTIRYHYRDGKWTTNECKIRKLDNFVWIYRH